MQDTPPADPGAAEPPEIRAEAPAIGPRRRLVRNWRFWAVLIFFTPILLFVVYTIGALTWTYSEGTRAGYLQKFSKKGWICKTWEGELAQAIVPGIAPTIWSFTVRGDAAARQLNLALGRRVLLFYREHRGIPSRCFGETNYFVDSVKIIR